jgi:phage N-6-adenine-methyltransferase
MTLNSGLMTSNRDDWETPNSLFDILDKIFKFDLDAAANHKNAKCLLFYSPKTNAFTKDWAGNGNVWLNPPYGRDVTEPWVNKAYEESQKGAVVVCLLPARTETKWFQTLWKANHLVFLRGRVRFVGGKSCAPFPSVVAIFGKKLTKRQRTALDAIGQVITP